MQIAVINQSTMVNNDQCQIMCAAIQTQITRDVLPNWNFSQCTITFYADQKAVPEDAWLVNMLDNSTQAGALGYHAEDNGRIDAFIFAAPVLQNKGVVLYDASNPQNTSVSSVLSHEVIEMIGDAYANFWADGPEIKDSNNQAYTEYALELCDAVENGSYSIDVNGQMVSVSNFVLPSWFNAQATAKNAPFDFLKVLTAPFTMTGGGYVIVRQAGNTQEIFAEMVSTDKREHVKSEWYRR